MPSEYDDELWLLVGEHRHPPPGHLVEFVRGLGRHDGAALDLGCGDGRLTAELRVRRRVGADVSRVALDRGRKRADEEGIELVELTPGAVLPFRNGEFELVLVAEVLEHVVDPQTFLAEAHRVLQPGGEIAVTTPAHGRRSGLSMLFRGFERQFDPLSPHVRFFARDTLRELLEDAGFELQSLTRRKRTLYARATR